MQEVRCFLWFLTIEYSALNSPSLDPFMKKAYHLTIVSLLEALMFPSLKVIFRQFGGGGGGGGTVKTPFEEEEGYTRPEPRVRSKRLTRDPGV